jgi:hypothetical protein
MLIKQLTSVFSSRELTPAQRLKQNWETFKAFHEKVNSSSDNYVPPPERPTSSLSNLVRADPKRIKAQNKRGFSLFGSFTQTEESSRAEYRNKQLLKSRELNQTLIEIGRRSNR